MPMMYKTNKTMRHHPTHKKKKRMKWRLATKTAVVFVDVHDYVLPWLQIASHVNIDNCARQDITPMSLGCN